MLKNYSLCVKNCRLSFHAGNKDRIKQGFTTSFADLMAMQKDRAHQCGPPVRYVDNLRFALELIGEDVSSGKENPLNDIATIPANLSGIPGISLPSGLADEDGLPTGIQILAPATRDERLYGVGAALEAALVQRWGGPLLARAPELPTGANGAPTTANGREARA